MLLLHYEIQIDQFYSLVPALGMLSVLLHPALSDMTLFNYTACQSDNYNFS